MREILFRGKTEDGEWVYGDVKHDCDGVPKAICDHCGSNPIIPETIGQYTGLTDKNGKKIFEGDILRGFLSLHPDRKIYRVIYEENGFYYRDEDEVAWHPDHITCVEVIGNIHDNRLEDFEDEK